MLQRLLLAGLVPQVVLGSSFSLSFERIRSDVNILLPSTPGFGRTAHTSEFDEQVWILPSPASQRFDGYEAELGLPSWGPGHPGWIE
jgi:hypothetical protein